MDSVYEWAPRDSIDELFRTGSIFNTKLILEDKVLMESYHIM